MTVIKHHLIIMPEVGPLSNPGTSRVFLCIIKGKKNPKATADFLGIKPPPVIEQLRRLRSIGVVKLGEKAGKEQNYEIDWDKFLVLFIEQAMQKRKKTKDVLVYELPEEVEKIRTLKGNKYFKQLVEFYMNDMAEGKTTSWYKISDAIANFENVLRQSSSFKRNKKFEDFEKQAFFDKMRIWYNRTLAAKTWMDLCLHDAIYKTLGKQ